MKKTIDDRVHKYYWDNDYNCATTMIKILGEIHNVELHQQALDAALAMHGAGQYGAQCGLVEGTLMFLGIYGRLNNIKYQEIIKKCYVFADEFNKKFNSLSCSALRPVGFKPENPPHLCEDLTKRAVKFAVQYIDKMNVK